MQSTIGYKTILPREHALGMLRISDQAPQCEIEENNENINQNQMKGE